MINGVSIVWVRADTKEKLLALKQDGETFDELIKKMIEAYKKVAAK